MKRFLSVIALMSTCIIGNAQIDIHSHMIPESYMTAVKAMEWRWMRASLSRLGVLKGI